MRTALGTGIGPATDLAYEYGEYACERNNATQRGIYVCIWRLDSDSTWRIALDLQKSAPEKNRNTLLSFRAELRNIFLFG
jgi:hypothetical protein